MPIRIKPSMTHRDRQAIAAAPHEATETRQRRTIRHLTINTGADLLYVGKRTERERRRLVNEVAF